MGIEFIFIIYGLMLSGIVFLVFGNMLYPSKIKNYITYKNKSKLFDITEYNIITKLYVMIYVVLIILMCIVAVAVGYAVNGYKGLFFCIILYTVLFIGCVIVRKKEEKKIYICTEGAWLNISKGDIESYTLIEKSNEDINDKLIEILIANKNYVLESNARDAAVRNALLSNKRLLLKYSFAVLIKWIGIVVLILSLVFASYSTGAGQIRIGCLDDYKSIHYQEQAKYGQIEEVIKNDKGNYYVSYEGFSVVDVYDNQGEFLYAYKVPDVSQGEFTFALYDEKVYLKSRRDEVYIYKETLFLKKVLYENLTDKEQNALMAYNTDEMVDYNSNEEYSGIPIREKALAGEKMYFLVLLSAIMYLLGRYFAKEYKLICEKLSKKKNWTALKK